MTDKEKEAIEKLNNGKKMNLMTLIRTFKKEQLKIFLPSTYYRTFLSICSMVSLFNFIHSIVKLWYFLWSF